MSEYKLYYFNGRGLGEVTRQLFAISNTPFEDVRVDHEKWLNDKTLQEKMPFGQMPVLEVDGQLIPQSIAVARYVARKTGHAGKCPYEEAIVDALADQYKDYYVEIRGYFYPAIGFPPTEPEKVEQLKKDILIPARNKYFKYLTAFLQKSSSGFLAGNELTFADLILAEHVSTLKAKVPEYTEGFPEIEKHLQKIHNIPELKKWLASRPETPF